MRIATSMIFERGVNALLREQREVSKTELQLASGNRMLSAADDPTAAARVLDLNREIETITQYQRNIERTRSRLELEDATLEGGLNLLQRVRELTVQGANDTLSADDRRAIGYEVGQLRDELFGLVNTRDANGEYIFSGFQGDVPAYADAGGGSYVYQGDQGQRRIRIGHGRQIADGDNGFDLFGDIPTALDADGDGATDGRRDLLETLDLLVRALDGTALSAPGSGAAAEDARLISNYLGELDTAMNNILDVRAQVGARLDAIDAQDSVHQDFLLTLEATRSEERDLDYAEAVSRFQQQLTALQASQQSFVKIQDLSLFKFL
jgi:flagellar hook-associated protein 3 FlgL